MLRVGAGRIASPFATAVAPVVELDGHAPDDSLCQKRRRVRRQQRRHHLHGGCLALQRAMQRQGGVVAALGLGGARVEFFVGVTRAPELFRAAVVVEGPLRLFFFEMSSPLKSQA